MVEIPLIKILVIVKYIVLLQRKHEARFNILLARRAVNTLQILKVM